MTYISALIGSEYLAVTVDITVLLPTDVKLSSGTWIYF